MKNKLDVIFRIVFGIILVAMAVLLGITGYRYNNMSIALNKISNQLSYLEDTSKVIESNVDNLEAELSSILQEDTSMIEDYSVRVTGCDFANGTYDVLITVVPREYTDTTEASIYFGTTEYRLALNRYAYQGTASLPIDTSYDGNITILFADGNKKNTEVVHSYVGFQTMASDILRGSTIAMPEYVDGVLSISDDVTVNLDGNGLYEFQTLCYVVEADDQILYAQDLLEEDAQDLEDEAGEAEETGETEKDIQENEQNQEKLSIEELVHSYSHDSVWGVSKEYAVSAEKEVTPGAKIRVMLVSYTAEGYRFEYDLFNGVLKDEQEGFVESADYFAPHFTMYDEKGGRWNIK